MRMILMTAFALLLTPTPALAQDGLIPDAAYCEVVADDARSCHSLLAAFSAREQGLPVSGAEFCALAADDVAVCEDPQCPACGLFTSRIEPLLIAGPISDGEVYFTYKDMTFLGPESFEAAAAMRVAEELDGKFWEYHDVLFHNQGTENAGAFSTSRLADMAELIGLDRDEFLAELADPRSVEAVQAEFDEARELGINSTPTLVVNGGLHPGVPDWDELRELIAAERS